MIQFENVIISHQSPLIQVEIQQLSPGKMYALIGSNGSGKSTFLKTITSQNKPLRGTISIQGKNTQVISSTESAKLIAFVPARFPETEFLMVKEFVALGRTPYLSNFGNLSAHDQNIVNSAIEKVGISHLSDQYLNLLSDGERQLCSVARALSQQTPIILLDEPTGFLDYKNKRRLLQLLQDLTKEMQLTIVFSTHDIESLQEFDIETLGITLSNQQTDTLSKLIPLEKEEDIFKKLDEFYR